MIGNIVFVYLASAKVWSETVFRLKEQMTMKV